jgi:hypothetical protein
MGRDRGTHLGQRSSCRVDKAGHMIAIDPPVRFLTFSLASKGPSTHATTPLQRHVRELLGYLERNEGALVHYAARRRCGEPISTAFVESAVNEIVAKRMNKKQQMRWNRTTVQPFLDVRTAVLKTRSRTPSAGAILASVP